MFPNVVSINTSCSLFSNLLFETQPLVKMVIEDCSQFQDGHSSDEEGGP